MNEMIEKLRPEIIEKLVSWIRIPSVKADPLPGAPFGAEVRRALDKALDDAKALGFEVRDFDGYAADVRMGPKGVNPLAVLAHLDVVPKGEGWHHDPFAAEIEDGKVYGRGTSDDKGPALAALYAMYALKQAGVPLKREVRLILGCDEESGWECMHHYAEVCDMPKTGFSPDASYPVINTEKGMLHLNLRGAYCEAGLQVKEFNVGERTNVVPGTASAIVYGDQAFAEKAAELAAEKGWDITAEALADGTVKLFSLGVTGHAAYPESTKNAIGQLLLLLKEMGVEGALKTAAERIGMEYYGESLDVVCSDAVSGPLTCNMGIIRYSRENGFYATLDIRYPILINHEALTESITAALAPDVQVEFDSWKKPHHVSPHSKLVGSLLKAYNEVTGLPMDCLSTGGGTYARVLEEGVAFGAGFPGDEDLAHQADEYISIDGMVKNVRIIARAIELLQDD